MINVVAFSKDRACQMDALIRSIKDHMKIDYKLSVMYNFSNNEFGNGYRALEKAHPEGVNFVKETHYYNDTVRLSCDDSCEFLFWLVDDCIIKNDITEDATFVRFATDPAVGIYNLRMTPTMEYMADDDGVVHEFPTFLQDNTWEWRNAKDGFWGDPVTMDGHMYKTKDIVPYLAGIRFGPPPSMDVTMKDRYNTNLLICNTQQKVMGIVPNRVQTGWPNRHGNVTTKELNDIWLSGKRIVLEKLYELDENYMRHLLMPLDFEDRV